MSSASRSNSPIWSVDPSRVWLRAASDDASAWARTAESARRALRSTTNATAAATTTKTASATAFWGCEIVRPPVGGVKNQLRNSDDATAPSSAGPMPPSSAMSTLSRRKSGAVSGRLGIVRECREQAR